MDPVEHNRGVWDRAGVAGGRWSEPVDAATVAEARAGRWEVVLTPQLPVPADWFPPLAGLDVLGLAAGGGQQGPILAAAGATVTVADFSEGQLAKDRAVADREGLALRTVQADMRDLSPFADESFDLVLHPSSNAYVETVQPVWDEAFRVLRPGGALLAGFNNPGTYLFDLTELDAGRLLVRHPLPFSDTDLPADELAAQVARGIAVEYSHSLTELIGGQLAAGFELVGFYEDRMPDDPVGAYLPTSIATRARKPLTPRSG